MPGLTYLTLHWLGEGVVEGAGPLASLNQRERGCLEEGKELACGLHQGGTSLGSLQAPNPGPHSPHPTPPPKVWKTTTG